MSRLRAIVHASELLTGAGVRRKDGRRIVEEDLGIIPDGALVYSTRTVRGREVPDRIVWVGPTSDIPKRYAKACKTNLKGRRALIPGLVDCHTHLVFGGDRSEEFAARCAGTSYQEIAAKGGGILATVRATREATVEELEELAVARISESASYGVRTIEIKSGYGLSCEAEFKILEVIRRLGKHFPELTIVPTFLGAHAFPAERSRDEYMRELLDKMIPRVAEKNLARGLDVFIDAGYYSVVEGRRLLTLARSLGLNVRVHADELSNTGSAALAAEVGALSADHLLCVSDDGIRALALSETVAVLLPGTAFYLKARHAPARKLLDAGAVVALASDFNPGTCMCLSLPAVMTIAALYLGMSRAEIFAAVTYNGAKALGLQKNQGTIESGLKASFTVLPFARFEESYYRFAWRPDKRE